MLGPPLGASQWRIPVLCFSMKTVGSSASSSSSLISLLVAFLFLVSCGYWHLDLQPSYHRSAKHESDRMQSMLALRQSVVSLASHIVIILPCKTSLTISAFENTFSQITKPGKNSNDLSCFAKKARCLAFSLTPVSFQHVIQCFVSSLAVRLTLMAERFYLELRTCLTRKILCCVVWKGNSGCSDLILRTLSQSGSVK